MKATRALIAVTVLALIVPLACSSRRTLHIVFLSATQMDATNEALPFTVSYYPATSCTCADSQDKCGAPIGTVTFERGDHERVADSTPDGDLTVFVTTARRLCNQCQFAADLLSKQDITFRVTTAGTDNQCPK